MLIGHSRKDDNRVFIYQSLKEHSCNVARSVFGVVVTLLPCRIIRTGHDGICIPCRRLTIGTVLLRISGLETALGLGSITLLSIKILLREKGLLLIRILRLLAERIISALLTIA